MQVGWGGAFGRKLQDDEACVRGTYVRGLTRVDVLSLDAFEGDVSLQSP